MARVFALALSFGLILAMAGCSDEGAGKLAVRGTVKFENKPLATGNIFFELDDANNPHISGATIDDGKFTIDKNRGLKPGTYLVRISSADPKLKEENQAPGDSRQLAKDRIPPDWNTNSKQKIEVKAGSTEFTFDIK
jgi:hypothetical protein